MLQHGHTVAYNFNTDITISESVKDIAAQKFDTVINSVNKAQDNEENGKAMLRAIHKIDVTNANRTKITPSITEMYTVKSV